MATTTIKGDGFEDFMSSFFGAMQSGVRFKACNFDEAIKNSITKVEDYNFFTNRDGLAGRASAYSFIEVEKNYSLPPNVNITQYLGTKTPELTFGAYLMMVQHVIDAGGILERTLTYPAKSGTPAFVGLIGARTGIMSFDKNAFSNGFF